MKVIEPFVYPPDNYSFDAICHCGEKVNIKVRYLWGLPEGERYKCKKCVSLTYATPGEEIQRLFREKQAEPLFTVSEYKNRNSILKFKCSCGKIDATTWENSRFRNTILCKECRYASKRLDTEYVKKMYLLANKQPLFEKYVTGREALPCKCLSCQAEYNLSIYDVLKQVKAGKPSCRNCNTERRKLTEEEVRQAFVNKGLTPLFTYADYKNRTTPLKVKCSCGNEIFRSMADIYLCSGLCAECQFKQTQVRGETHGRFNPLLKREKYDPYLHSLWKKDLKRLWDNKCLLSRKETKPLIAHHLLGKTMSKLNVFNISNGVLLHPDLHTAFHKAYGFGKNTEKQFKAWVSSLGYKYKIREIQKKSDFFVSKQLLQSDFYYFCSKIGVSVSEHSTPYLYTLKKGGKIINLYLIKTNRKQNLSLLANLNNRIMLFEQEFLNRCKRQALFRELKFYFDPKPFLSEIELREITKREAVSFLRKHLLEDMLPASLFIGGYVENKLISVFSFKVLPEKAYCSYKLVQGSYLFPAAKDRVLEQSIGFLKYLKNPMRIQMEFNKRFQPLLPVPPLEFEAIKDTGAKLFYARNSFNILPERLFQQRTGIKRLEVFDPAFTMEENLHLNRYHTIQDLGNSRFLYSRKKIKKEKRIKEDSSFVISPCIEVPPEIDELAKAYVQHYYMTGFPYPTFNAFEKMQILKELKSQHPVLEGNKLKQGNHGASLLWSYFPHAWDISCNKRKTVMDVFKNEALFSFVLKENLKKKDKLSPSDIRSILRTSLGVQAVSNFRPLAAKALYDLFAGEGVVYDMCAGFGGRLLGAIVSDRVKKYIGVDPSTKTFEGLLQIKQEFGGNKEIELICACAEDIQLPSESVDFCFTSPPYFNCEFYAKELTQSCVKFKTKEEWIEGFFRKMIVSCHSALKKEGTLAINIANVPSFRNLVETAIRVVIQQGFVLVDTIEYVMSSFGKKSRKFEPIFIFKKKGVNQ